MGDASLKHTHYFEGMYSIADNSKREMQQKTIHTQTHHRGIEASRE